MACAEKRRQSLRKSANDQSTFMPMKAGNLVLRKFMIVLSMLATAPGFVTKSLRLGTRALRPSFDATPAALLRYSDFRP